MTVAKQPLCRAGASGDGSKRRWNLERLAHCRTVLLIKIRRLLLQLRRLNCGLCPQGEGAGCAARHENIRHARLPHGGHRGPGREPHSWASICMRPTTLSWVWMSRTGSYMRSVFGTICRLFSPAWPPIESGFEALPSNPPTIGTGWLTICLMEASDVVHLAHTVALPRYRGLKHSDDTDDARYFTKELALDGESGSRL